MSVERPGQSDDGPKMTPRIVRTPSGEEARWLEAVETTDGSVVQAVQLVRGGVLWFDIEDLEVIAGEGRQERPPEDVCRRCGGPNVSWSAPSPLWNAVMRGGSITGPWEFNELICPTCFVVLAEERGVASGWRIDAQEVAVELETVTPSGRVWNPERWLWDEDDASAGTCS